MNATAARQTVVTEAREQQIARRRRANPIRDARRQAHLTRMLRRVVDFVPTYRDTRDHTGQIVSSKYLRHVPILAVRGTH